MRTTGASSRDRCTVRRLQILFVTFSAPVCILHSYMQVWNEKQYHSTDNYLIGTQGKAGGYVRTLIMEHCGFVFTLSSHCPRTKLIE